MGIIDKSANLDRKMVISTLWIFTVLNYLYCDVVGLMNPVMLSQYLTGNVEGMKIDESFLIKAAVLIEIPIAMVLLSRILTYRVNRWANVIASSIMTVVMIVTMFIGSGPTMYYLFFGTIEILTTLFIIWYAWRWIENEALTS